MFGEKIGRRYCIIFGCVILAIGAALQCSAFTIPHLIVGRIVAGIGNGMNTSAIRECSISLGNASISANLVSCLAF